MGYSLFGGGFGAVWFLLASPQQILTVYVKNYLGATASQLGLFIAAFNIVSLAHLGSIFFYNKRKSIKPFWLLIGLIHRSMAFVVAFSSFYVAMGGDRSTALAVVVGATLATFFIGSTASSGWWTWIHELVPSQAMGSYFGKRSAVAQGMNIFFFFAATFSLDIFSSQVFIVYGIIYLAAGILGLLEHALHLPIPEPASALNQAERTPLKLGTFFAPLRSKTYRSFCLIAGTTILAINVANPFFPAYITDPARIGVPNIWLGIMYAISQLSWVLLVPFWGTVMDRFGRKPVTMFGMLSALSFLGYIVITPSNYPAVLIITALVWGFFAPALYEGLNQIMFVLLPRRDRTIYIAWFWAMLGTISAIGPILGGLLLDSTQDIRFVVLTSLGLLICSFLLMDNLQIKKEKRFSRVFPTITTPTIVKAYYNMPYIAKAESPRRVGRALRRMSGSSSGIALNEIALRLDDPDEEIREEAVKALGRIGGEQAIEILIAHLSNEDSLIRTACARALGTIGSAQAVPYLIDGLSSSDEDFSEACARGLGNIDDVRGSEALIKLITGESTLRVKVTSAQAISQKGYLNAVEDILKIRERTNNPIMRKQLAISIANLLGRPGEFYTLLTGTEEHREEESEKLFRGVYRNLRILQKSDKGFIQHIVKDILPSAIESYEQWDYDGCFDQLYSIVSNLLYRFVELQGEDVKTTTITQLGSTLFKQEPHLYAGFILFQWLEKHREQDPIEQVGLLLCFYFLKYYGRAWKNKPPQPPKKHPAI